MNSWGPVRIRLRPGKEQGPAGGSHPSERRHAARRGAEEIAKPWAPVPCLVLGPQITWRPLQPGKHPECPRGGQSPTTHGAAGCSPERGRRPLPYVVAPAWHRHPHDAAVNHSQTVHEGPDKGSVSRTRKCPESCWGRARIRSEGQCSGSRPGLRAAPAPTCSPGPFLPRETPEQAPAHSPRLLPALAPLVWPACRLRSGETCAGRNSFLTTVIPTPDDSHSHAHVLSAR